MIELLEIKLFQTGLFFISVLVTCMLRCIDSQYLYYSLIWLNLTVEYIKVLMMTLKLKTI